MLRITLKNLAARKLRLITTGLAVMLGVAFMAGTLVLTDTIGKTFDDLFADVNAGTDAFVRAESVIDGEFGQQQRGRVDANLVDEVAAVEGVATAEGTIQGYTQIVDKEGEPVGDPGNGAPTYGGNWPQNQDFNPFDLVAGRAPERDDEVVIDKGSADNAGYRVGDSATVLVSTGPAEVTVVGIAKFGTADSPGGASYVLFTDNAAQKWVAEQNRYDGIQVVADGGLSEEEIRSKIAAAMPDGIEVVTGSELTKENQDAIQEGLSFFNIFLFIFAAVALFVGSFIIYNTFSIIVAQRTREMALMRAIGASRRQVLGSLVMEAVVVGAIASLVGIVLGIGVAGLLKALLAAFGIDIPAGGLVFKPSTVIISLVVGVLVTVVAAVFPARRAAKVPPIAALRDVAIDHSAGSKRRIVAGAAITALGAASLLSGLFGGGSNAAAQVGFGAAVVFLGVAVLGPVIARPLSNLIGAPLPAVRGMAGTLARENAIRNPKRTSATAAALMIGVGLVGFITIFASSTKASIDATLDRAFIGDFVIDSGTYGFGGLSPELANEVNTLAEVDAATGIRFALAEVEDSPQNLIAIDPGTAPDIFDIGVADGSLDDLDENGVFVLDDTAADKNWSVGDTVDVTFAETGDQKLEIAGIYTEGDLTEGTSFLIGHAAYNANVPDQFDAQVYVNLAEDVSVEDGRRALSGVTDKYPTAELQDRSEYKDAQGAQIDQLLNLIYVMLALAVVIALLGIANTLALSIFERTRELGLLRAVGMTRSQMRAMVRWESVIIAMMGTLLGLVIGLFFGWALVEALADEGINTLEIPWGQLAVVTLIGGLAGVVAAVLPAYRASKLNVLEAIATQ